MANKSEKSTKKYMCDSSSAGGGAVYGLGVVGAVIYFFQQAESFWEYVLVIFKALLWPAIVVYQLLTSLL